MIPENVRFTDRPAADIRELFDTKGYSKLVLVVDTNTARYCYPKLDELPTHDLIQLPEGEEHKNLETCISIWQQMTNLSLDRHALVVVLGGGVLGDMVGFCAATYKRGVDFVLIPTTLLSLVDASVGGKLGVDFDHYKNHIGVFKQPVVTLLCSQFLSTLSKAELKSGYAEVIKHTLISDRGWWDRIRSTPFDQLPWEELIRHSVVFKATVTVEDPYEKGLRKILNTGHTIGHAVETYFIGSGKRILHGEAIAIGLIAEAWLAQRNGNLSEEELGQIANYIRSVYPALVITREQAVSIAALAMQDKKNKGGKILCVFLEGIGRASWDHPIREEQIVEALSFYNDQR
jgi:3-dehydroquinate synthase